MPAECSFWSTVWNWKIRRIRSSPHCFRRTSRTVVYKENRSDWNRAEIVVTTVQSLLFNNKYQQLFSPTDFDLVISDEAHRSIGGNARAVFDFFVGYKLGLTATPRDYLKGTGKTGPATRDPRETERRLLLDTYRTFGCESGQPTFRYSLLAACAEVIGTRGDLARCGGRLLDPFDGRKAGSRTVDGESRATA